MKLKAVNCKENAAEIRQNDDEIHLDSVTSLCTVQSGGTENADWTSPNFDACPGSESITTTATPTTVSDDKVNDMLDDFADIIVKDPEAGAEMLAEATKNVDQENWSENATENFANTIWKSIDDMPKPISEAASKSFLNSMTNMLRNVFGKIM